MDLRHYYDVRCVVQVENNSNTARGSQTNLKVDRNLLSSYDSSFLKKSWNFRFMMKKRYMVQLQKKKIAFLKTIQFLYWTSFHHNWKALRESLCTRIYNTRSNSSFNILRKRDILLQNKSLIILKQLLSISKNSWRIKLKKYCR